MKKHFQKFLLFCGHWFRGLGTKNVAKLSQISVFIITVTMVLFIKELINIWPTVVVVSLLTLIGLYLTGMVLLGRIYSIKD